MRISRTRLTGGLSSRCHYAASGYRTVPREPPLDAILVRRDRLPFRTRVRQRARLHPLRDIVDLTLGQLTALRQRAALRGAHVAAHRLSVDAWVDLPLPAGRETLPRAQMSFRRETWYVGSIKA
jgi:hypothetical protein